MNEDLLTALTQWCNYALDVANVEQLHVREAMNWREDLRAAIAGGLELHDDDQAALDTADELFARASARVLPLLKYGGWLDRRPPEHYARQYARKHS